MTRLQRKCSGCQFVSTLNKTQEQKNSGSGNRNVLIENESTLLHPGPWGSWLSDGAAKNTWYNSFKDE